MTNLGILPGGLTYNKNGQYIDRWVDLQTPISARQGFCKAIAAYREARLTAPSGPDFPPQNQWAALRAAHQMVGQKSESLILEPGVGLEPTTYALSLTFSREPGARFELATYCLSRFCKNLSLGGESNSRSAVYKTAALPLSYPGKFFYKIADSRYCNQIKDLDNIGAKPLLPA